MQTQVVMDESNIQMKRKFSTFYPTKFVLLFNKTECKFCYEI